MRVVAPSEPAHDLSLVGFRGGCNFAPDESCEADVSGLASFILFEGDGGVSPAVSPIVSALSLDAANVTSFVGLGVRLSSSGVAASPIEEGASMRSWTGGVPCLQQQERAGCLSGAAFF